MSIERIGNYEILGEIGRGGMGVVYRGVDSFIKRPVAIKTIYLSEIQEDQERHFLKERLYREAQSAGILSHPNIVTIYQIGEQDDLTYIVMEFVDGKNLSQILRAGGKPSAETLLSIFDQTAAGLDHAHGHGVVHRDIKPANIIVRADGAAKITDFGVAKITSQSVTRTGMTLGTPQFMAPEQIQGKLIDGRADQYSLGVMIYEIFTGHRPFKAETITSLIFKIVTDPVDPKRDNPDLSDAAASVLKRALAKEPADRYPSCQAMVLAFRTAIGASPSPIPNFGEGGFMAREGASVSNAGLPPRTGTGTLSAAVSLPPSPPPASSIPAPRPPTPAAPPVPPIPPSPVTSSAVSPPHPPPRAAASPSRVPATAPAAELPGNPWRFPLIAAAGLLIVAAIFGIAWLFLTGGGPATQVATSSPSNSEALTSPVVGEAGAGNAAQPAGEPNGLPSAPEEPQPSAADPVAASLVKPASPPPNSATPPSQGSKPSGAKPANSPPPPATPAKGVKTPSGSTGPAAERPVDATYPGQTKAPPAGRESASPPVFTPPKPILRIPAIYPAAARRDGVSGSVLLQAVVNEAGQATAVTVVRGIRPDLDQAAKDALTKWRFQPGTSDGSPVESRINVEIAFNLVQNQRNPGSLKNP